MIGAAVVSLMSMHESCGHILSNLVDADRVSPADRVYPHLRAWPADAELLGLPPYSSQDPKRLRLRTPRTLLLRSAVQ
jgi:hypothetical protein